MKRSALRQEGLMRAVAEMGEAELAAMTYTVLTELAYRHRTDVRDVASRIEAPTPWALRRDEKSGEVRPMLTLAGECWERITGRKLVRRHRQV